MEFHWYQLLIPVAAATIGYYARHLIERKKELQSEVNKERRVIYQKFVNMVLDMIPSAAKLTDEQASDFDQRMVEFYKKFVLYASPDVVNAMGNYRQYSFKAFENITADFDPRPSYSMLAKVISEMRGDLGLSNWRMGANGKKIFKSILLDYDEIFERKLSIFNWYTFRK